MIKLTKNGIGLLSRLYRSILHKCALINVGLWTFGAATLATPTEVYAGVLCNDGGTVKYYNEASCASGTLITSLAADSTNITSQYIKTSGAVAAVAYSSGDIAIGDGAVAGNSGQMDYYHDTAIGANAKAQAFSTAIGANANAGGIATAIGNNAKSSGYSTAIGHDAYSYLFGTSVGQSTYTNSGATAIGNGAKAWGENSLALGSNATVGAGSETTVSTNTKGAVALGANSKTLEDYTVSVGSGDTTATGDNANYIYRKIINVKDGVNDHDAATVGQVKGYFGDGLTYNSTTGQYDVTGGGSSYTAGTGISIDNDEIALDSDYMSNNYYTKSQADSAISTAVAGKANAADVYTKDEVYTKSEINTTLTNYVTNDSLSTTLGDYAKTEDVYTKSEVYTKDETDSAISAAISGKADATDVTALQTTVSNLSDTVATKANQSDLEALQTTVDTKANAADVYTKDETDSAISTAVATKAEQADLEALQTTVESKADASDVATLQTNVTDLNITVAKKADADKVYTKSETDKAIFASASTAVGDRSNYSEQNYIHNNETVAQSLDYLDKAINQVSKNTAAIQAENQARFSNIEHRINKLENKMQKGLAANNALAALKPLSGDKYKTQLSISMGGYESNQAAAIGAFHYVSDRVVLNTGVAYGGNDSMSYNVGVTFGF